MPWVTWADSMTMRDTDHGIRPDAPRAVALNFLTWVRRQAWLQPIYRIAPESMRLRLADLLKSRSAARLRFPRTEAWSRPLAAPEPVVRVASDAAACGPGLDIHGFIRGQFGLGESARLYSRALLAAGCDVALHDVDLGLPHGWDDHSLDAFMRDASVHPVSIVFVNPDCFDQALDHIGRERLSGKFIIGCWFWELERIPDAWLGAVDQVDAIMVASAFIEDAFRRVTDKPILRVPIPLSPVSDSGLQRQDFGLDEGCFTFLTSFDFNSATARKNPLAAIAAFRAAFPAARQDVRLVVKSSNGHRYDHAMRDLLQAVAGDPRIILRDEVIDRAHVHALQRCCDAYVSLHRAEGFGLGLAECMALGKPVIATGWSGNLEFMDEHNACLVDYTLVPVAEGEYPDSAGASWAEVDLHAAAAAMRKLADAPRLAEDIGRRGQQDVRRRLAPAGAADAFITQLAAIRPLRSHIAGGLAQ